MKNTRLFVTCFIIVLCFAAGILGSCTKKNACSGVTCQNTGACSGGKCTCPSGYTGQYCQYSSILFQNNTLVPVVIAISSTNSKTIPAGESQAVVGSAGTSLDALVSTTAPVAGNVLSWSFTNNFPINGYELTQAINVDTPYFFLYAKNASGVPTSYLIINEGLGTGVAITDNIIMQSNDSVYALGYFHYYSGSKIAVSYSNGDVYVTPPLTMSGSVNATATATLLY